MKRPRRWTVAPMDAASELEALVQRLVDLALLDAEALLRRDPALRAVLVADLDHALETADSAIRRLTTNAAQAPSDVGGRRQRAAWLSLASRLERCASKVQSRRESLN